MLVHEYTLPIVFGIGDVPIKIKTPCDLFDDNKAGGLAYNPNATPMQNLLELSRFVENAAQHYPEIFTDRLIKNIFTVHIAYQDNATEKEMISILKNGCSKTMRKNIKSVVDRVDPLVFLDEEIINLLKD